MKIDFSKKKFVRRIFHNENVKSILDYLPDLILILETISISIWVQSSTIDVTNFADIGYPQPGSKKNKIKRSHSIFPI